jgi:DNA processing protein
MDKTIPPPFLERDYIIGLNLLPEMGPVRFQNLMSAFGSAQNVFKATAADLKNIEGISENTANHIISGLKNVDPAKEVADAQKAQVKILTCIEDEYPQSLKTLHDFPPVLYIKGQIKQRDYYGVAIVGTRQPTNYGISCAAKFAREFAQSGITTFSGLARGIDKTAHETSLEAGGRTVALLGNGLNHHYPPENRRLEEKIVLNGALVSEFPLNTRPDKANFPRRNRLIAGFTLATLVVEADVKSGALITAEFAVQQGKDVFAVPGSIFSKYSSGTNNLLRQGAAMAQSAQDIIDEIRPLARWLKKENLQRKPAENFGGIISQEQEKILSLIQKDPQGVSVDYLAANLDMAASPLAAGLLELELKGFIRNMPGNVYIKK